MAHCLNRGTPIKTQYLIILIIGPDKNAPISAVGNPTSHGTIFGAGYLKPQAPKAVWRPLEVVLSSHVSCGLKQDCSGLGFKGLGCKGFGFIVHLG